MSWLQSAAFSFLVPAGAIYDPPGRLGLATLTCEMAIRGAGQRDSRQFLLELDNLGVEHHESVSSAHVSMGGATLAENLLPALSLFADVLRKAHLPEDQLENGRMVVLQDLRALEDEPSEKVMIELRGRHYAHPWGRSTQGVETDIEQTTIGDIRAFYRKYYQPRDSILAVAGNFDWAELKEQVGLLLGDWQATAQANVAEEPPPRGYLHVPFESSQTQIAMAYDSVPYCDPAYFQAWGAVGALSGGMSCRLFTEVRERRGLCYSVFASYHTLRDRGAVLCYAGTSAERAQETLDVLQAELVRLAAGIEASELSRLKARIKNALIMQQESSSARSASIARDWYHLGKTRTMDDLARLVDGLSVESINKYLREHPPKDFTIVTVGPTALQV